MDLKAWMVQQKTGRTVTVPSGLDVTLKANYGLMDLVMDGGVPESSEEFVDNLMSGDGVQIRTSDMGHIGTLVDLLLAEALMGPEGLTVEALPAGDRMFLFSLLANETEQETGVGAFPDGDGVQSEAEQFVVGAVESKDGAAG